MSLQNLDREKLKLILKTSEGFPTQHGRSQAMVINGQLSPSRSGHSLGQHLRGVQQTIKKTKFCSLDDMAKALELVLQTPDGTLAIRQLELQPGTRKTIHPYIDSIFDVEAELEVSPQQQIKFTRLDLRSAGFHRMRCCAALESRTRGSDVYLHVQTFYPEFYATEARRLLAAKMRY